MAEVARFNIPLANYPSGSREFGPVAIPSRIRSVRVLLARNTSLAPTIWPNEATSIDVLIELRYGTEWVPSGAFRMSGGPALDRQGNQREFAEAVVSWREATLQPNAGRLSASVSGGPLRTQGSLIFED